MASATPQAPPPATERRHFTIKSCLGRGGFGEVYRAVMTNTTGLETEVAIKVLHHDLDRESQAVERLRDEGRMLGTLTHASILRVLDLVVLDGRVGLVLEYVEGQDLAKCILPAAEMPTRAIIAVIGRVADALAAAWDTPSPGDRGPLHLIHRDIKPQNIRIGTQGDVKLLDFGIARSSKLMRESETRTGHMVGSYLYMAPECLLEARFGRESDVFALGATMYESLAHRRLFHGQSLRELYVLVVQDEAYTAHISQALAALDIEEPVRTLLAHMLSKDSAVRPTSAEVSIACDDLVDALPGLTLRRWCKQREWPPVNPVVGILDGRTITEATIASISRSDFTAPHAPKKPWDRGLLLGTAGGVFMLMGVLVGMIGIAVGLMLVVLPREEGSRWIEPFGPGFVGTVEAGESRSPERTVTGKLEPTPEPSSVPPRPRARARVMVDSVAAVDVRLVGNGRVYPKGALTPPGTYALQADWGEGFTTSQQITVTASTRTIAVKCNRYTRVCSTH